MAPNAAKVDGAATFPEEAIEALGEAGILGLVVPADVGGGGQGLRQAADVIGRLAEVCGSTAMVVMMHYAGTVVIDNHGPIEVRRAIGAGRHLTTLAFSEGGSRSHFWAPQSTAVRSDAAGSVDGAGVDVAVRLDVSKSWVTAAGHADSYVWSSRPLDADGPMSLWLVPSSSGGLLPGGTFDGLGLRGNNSTPVSASGVVVAADAMLGPDGAGLDALAHTAGLSPAVHDSLVVLAAGSWEPTALAVGWERVQRLQADMDEGRRRRLVRLGFSDVDAADVSDGRTRPGSRHQTPAFTTLFPRPALSWLNGQQVGAMTSESHDIG